MVLKRPFISDTCEDSALHLHCLGLLGEGALQVDTIVLLRRWPWNDHSLVTLESRICKFIVQVSWKSDLFQLLELFLGDVLEMTGHSALTLWRDTKWLLLLSPWTELFKLVALYLGDGFQMAGHSPISLEETLHSQCWFISWSWNICLCVQLDKELLLKGKP